MYEFHPYFTADGSVGLYNNDFDDIYHSATGALTEAYEKFIHPVDFGMLLQKDKINVLDICYGIGYNTKSFLNFILKNNCKKLSFTNDIESIYSDNISKDKNNIYNDEIYSDSIFSKIYIKAIDNDKILSYLSPFIKTGVKNFVNQKINFDFSKVDKYLKTKNECSKIDELINYLIFEKIAENCPDFLSNEDLNAILSSKDYAPYFDLKFKGLFQFYQNCKDKYVYKAANRLNLHNIYYKYLSKHYKNRLKRYKLQDIIFEIKNEDARKVVLEDNHLYNLIFLDAFTPSKCPCLWSVEFFSELFKRLEQDGMLLTYSVSPSIRSAMVEAGFVIGNIYNNRLNKSTGTVAVKKKELIKFPISDFDFGLLKTRSGIPYRDKNLCSTNESIVEARNSEFEKSNLISSSQYRKSKLL